MNKRKTGMKKEREVDQHDVACAPRHDNNQTKLTQSSNYYTKQQLFQLQLPCHTPYNLHRRCVRVRSLYNQFNVLPVYDHEQWTVNTEYDRVEGDFSLFAQHTHTNTIQCGQVKVTLEFVSMWECSCACACTGLYHITLDCWASEANAMETT